MPKIGPYKIPNHDIETVVDLLDEAKARVGGLTRGPLNEEMFKEEVLDRRGGSYSRYRFSLQQYGFIERSHGADEVEITELFIDVVDPLQRSDRENAIRQAVSNIDLLVQMYESEFDPGFSDTDLRIWLIQTMNIPRDEANGETIDDLRNLYEPAYQYLKQDGQPSKPDQAEKPEPNSVPRQPAKQNGGPQPTDSVKDMEEIQIGDKYVRLPRENISREWRMLKATVDAYIESMEEDESTE